jgi:prevent-host-death family protein
MGVVKVDATKAKNAFAELHARAQRTDVAITKHGHVQAYLVSPSRYRLLEAVSGPGQATLRRLDEAFDEMVARMQQEPHRKAIDAIETMSLSNILAAGAMAKAPRRPARVRGVARKARA